MNRSNRRLVATGLARAFLAGEWERAGMLDRGAEAIGASGVWLRVIVQDVLARHPLAPTDDLEPLVALVLSHEAFLDVWKRRWIGPSLRRWFPEIAAVASLRWPVRPLDTLDDVARWLALSPEQLEWFADRKGLERDALPTALQNFTYAWVPKRAGGARLLEAPKSHLKRIQRRLLRDVLDHIPPHPAAHGFRRGHSVLSHARLHVGQAVVVRFDLQAFFARVHTGRALGIFCAAGYPDHVAKTLIGLCTNRVPRSILARAPAPRAPEEIRPLFGLRRALAQPHLPQGSPTSPAIANLVAYGLDVRLSRLAEAYGAVYSRYADDLTFSGGSKLRHFATRLEPRVREIATTEGFVLNARKTRVMPASFRQEVTGIVVNRTTNVRRKEFDQLKAVLHRLEKQPPEGGSDRRAELAGRIAWVRSVNPARGATLHALFERVDWGNPENPDAYLE